MLDQFRAHNVIGRELCSRYETTRNFKELVDIRIAMADASFFSDDGDTATCLVRVGETLEATGRFAEEALFYLDVSMKLSHGLTNQSNYVSKSMAHDCAGTAFLRLNKNEEAAREILLALKEDYKTYGSVGTDELRK